MNTPFGGFNSVDDALEKGQSYLSSMKAQAAQQVKITGNAAVSQVGLPVAPPQADTANKQFIKELYGPSKPLSPDLGHHGEAAKAEVTDMINRSPEEQEKMAATRQELARIQQQKKQEGDRLHAAYFQSNFMRPQQKQETKQEEIERKNNQERWELQQKDAKKPPPLAVKRAAGRVELGTAAGG